VHYFVLFTLFLCDVGSMRNSDVDQLSSSHNSICGLEARKKKKKARDTLALPAKGFVPGPPDPVPSALPFMSCIVREKNRCLHSGYFGVLSFECAIQWGIRMRKKIPRVEDGWLFQSESEVDPILVGTHAWFDCLEQQSSFTFVDHSFTFTAQKSVLRTRDSYWKAYRRRQGKLYRIHLGHSHMLTMERLQSAAQAFAEEHVPGEQASVPSRQNGSNRLPKLPGRPSPRMELDVDHSTSLIHTKLYRPRLGSDLIPRPHLLERLNARLGGKVTLVSAPAGFGKTTLLVACGETIARPTAWLSLDENDDELACFVRSLTAALQSVFPDAFGATASLLQAPRFPTLDSLIALFSNDLADVPEDLLLVLDDFHRIRTSEVHSLLEQLVEHLPAQVHLVLSSRTDPHLPLARWEAQGHLHELRGSDLCFTLEETEAFLAHELGRVAAHEVAAALEERTEGWIAIVRLAALSLRNAPDRTLFLERLGHVPQRTISRYLVEEVLSQLAPAVQELLDRMSMLEQFCTDLCVAILDSDAVHEEVQATLKWLESSNLFLVPLGERQGWFRFHHLFQQLLRQRLQASRSTDEIALLHRRASAWYAEQGLIEEALEHALAAGDVSGATRQVEAHFFRAHEQEQWTQVERWLSLLPEDQIHGSPILLVARAWILQAHGQHNDVPHLLTAARQLLTTDGSGERDLDDLPSRILRASVATYWSQFQYFMGQVQASLESARSALEWISPGESYLAGLSMFWLALSYQAIGQEDVGLDYLQRALRDQSTRRNTAVRLLFAQGTVYLVAGKQHQLEHTARHLLQLAQEADLVISQNWAHLMLGVLNYEWDKLDAAVYHFSAVLANRHHAHHWAVRDSLCGLALTYQAKGLSKEAQETARSLLDVVQEENNMGELMIAYAFCGQLALLQEEVEEASRWLELAGEQEVWGPMFFLEDPPITTAHLLLAKGDAASVAQGQALLTHLSHYVETMHRSRKTIKVLALQAWAYDLQGRGTEASEVLERALALGRPGGFVRTFADLPPLLKVVAELRRRSKEQMVPDAKLDAYLQAILVAMNPKPSQAVSTKELMRQEGLDPLTERELQILRLLEKGLTNREIASELVVTPGTVKLHTKHVYRKLNVNNRQMAVTLARALGLLTAS
jgi:LuxR family transcriptional regulator, maltose regulon positive regulatory protein